MYCANCAPPNEFWRGFLFWLTGCCLTVRNCCEVCWRGCSCRGCLLRLLRITLADKPPVAPDNSGARRGFYDLGSRDAGGEGGVQLVQSGLGWMPSGAMPGREMRSASVVSWSASCEAAAISSSRWCRGQSDCWCSLSPSGQQLMRWMGSTASTISSIVMTEAGLASVKPPVGPRREVRTPACTSC